MSAEPIDDPLEHALRWQARGNAYFYWLTTRYPPFAWE